MLFKKSSLPGEDIRRFNEMVAERRKKIDETPATLLPTTYGVNELAKTLHPGTISAQISEIIAVSHNCAKVVLKATCESGRFPYFRAGQYVTLSTKIGSSLVTRPYSIVSSPKEAQAGRLEVIVQKSGLFSNWLLHAAKVGDSLIVGEPSGDFYHDNLRDKPTIVGIAGGSGVTPFISMIKSILEGSEDYNLVLIYGARTRKDLLIDPKAIKDNRIKIIVVLSDEKADGYEHGFITADLLKRLLPEQSSVFMCGPDAMYKFVGQEFAKLGIKDTGVRREHNSVGNRKLDNPQVFNLIVHIRNRVYTIPAHQEETLLTAMERAGLAAPSRCRAGSCGFCHSRLITGTGTMPKEHDFRRQADLKFGYIHPCCTYPDGDMEIDVPPYPALEAM